jgi:hypothetical protein
MGQKNQRLFYTLTSLKLSKAPCYESQSFQNETKEICQLSTMYYFELDLSALKEIIGDT